MTDALSGALSGKAVLRPAIPSDVDSIAELIRQLASYEKLSHEVVGDVNDLWSHLFGQSPCAKVVMAEWDGQTAGFALYFYNYSTFLMKPGLYLEDLFVLPDYRRRGIATALLSHLAQVALDQGCGRFEWSVLNWNEPAIAFYQGIGAQIMQDWRICRVTGAALTQLSQQQPKIQPHL
jgi:GNAT superfamily N-acetyltransferase